MDSVLQSWMGFVDNIEYTVKILCWQFLKEKEISKSILSCKIGFEIEQLCRLINMVFGSILKQIDHTLPLYSEIDYKLVSLSTMNGPVCDLSSFHWMNIFIRDLALIPVIENALMLNWAVLVINNEILAKLNISKNQKKL